MINYSNWKSTAKSIKQLSLDPENPRIPPSGRVLTESELIEELTLHDDVLEIAKSIAANGFFPSEALIAIRLTNKFVVVEGNRRLAACKVLDDPETSPAVLRPRFKTLAATMNLAFLKRLPVLIAPSREATDPLMIARHTSNQLEPWVPAMKAGFYARLLKGGMTVEEVAKKFGVDAPEVRKSLRELHLYQMACRLKLQPEAAIIVSNPREFPLTNLGRIFDNPKARDFFGVEFDENGKLRGKIAPEEFEKAFTKAVTDVATSQVDSRSLDTAENIQGYLDRYGGSAPDRTKAGSFDSTSFRQTAGTQVPVTGHAVQKKPKKSPVPVGLIPRSIACNVQNERVRDLLGELQRLSPERFPNACAAAFRCFLEISVYCYLNSKGQIAILRQEYEADIAARNAKLAAAGKPLQAPDPTWSPNLNTMMKRLADPTEKLLSDAQVTKALNRLVRDEEELFKFNLYNHNPTYHPTEQRLRTTWKNMEEFFKLILA